MVIPEQTNRGNPEDEIKKTPLQLAVLIASTGSASTLTGLLEAIEADTLTAEIQMVIANMSTAPGLTIAERNGIIALKQGLLKKDRDNPDEVEKHSSRLAQLLNKDGVQVAVLAGWPVILDRIFFDEFDGVTLNIHPGWIPDREDETVTFPDGSEAPWNRGLMTDDAVRNFLGGTYAGSTIHVATAETDFGPVLKRVYTTVKPDDTVEPLYKRLKSEEQKGLIEVLNGIQQMGIDEFKGVLL